MTKLINKIRGYKTYMVVAVSACVFIAQMLGYIDETLANHIFTALGITGVATMRSAIN